jgi:DNA-binding winged helix-turn-helix (wHTH) protein
MPRYRFGDFVVSPRRRLLVRQGRELPLIPRYFDLLVFLIDQREQAVHRREIFDRVWTDVIVSDSALSQAIRTIRRTLGDDSRDPRFIRTVARHGYRFVCADVIVEDDDEALEMIEAGDARLPADGLSEEDPFEPLLQRIVRRPAGIADEEEQRDAAERLHLFGTSEALSRLAGRPGHERARALLRDTRWETPHAGDVPVTRIPGAFAVWRALAELRLRRAARMVTRRWAGASLGGAAAGLVAGGAGGLILAALPASVSPVTVAPVLALVGGACGAIGGAGVGAGLSIAEAVARSRRATALVIGGALGGAVAGLVVQLLARWSLAALFDLFMEVGGGIEGLAIGAAAGIGYAAATSAAKDGLAAPRGARRLRAALITAACCSVAALCLTVAGRPLVGGTLHNLARAAHSAQVTLAPLGRLIGEPDFGPVSRAIIGAAEGALFGFGATVGLTRRP